jgi:hypothetical protein
MTSKQESFLRRKKVISFILPLTIVILNLFRDLIKWTDSEINLPAVQSLLQNCHFDPDKVHPDFVGGEIFY